MRYLTALILASSVALGTRSALAHGSHRPARTTTVAFQLRVAGTLPSSQTVWVAYGPVAGHFAIIRMHAAGNGLFVANSSVPAGSRGIYSYLLGNGAVKTRIGMVPGDPVVTIKRIGPAALSGMLPTVMWQAPIG